VHLLCRSFLTQYASVLNWNTTTALLEGYGRLEELEVFAGAKGDQEALLDYLMRNPDGAKRYAGCYPGVTVVCNKDVMSIFDYCLFSCNS